MKSCQTTQNYKITTKTECVGIPWSLDFRVWQAVRFRTPTLVQKQMICPLLGCFCCLRMVLVASVSCVCVLCVCYAGLAKQNKMKCVKQFHCLLCWNGLRIVKMFELLILFVTVYRFKIIDTHSDVWSLHVINLHGFLYLFDDLLWCVLICIDYPWTSMTFNGFERVRLICNVP